MTPYQEYRRLRSLARADRLLGFREVAEQMENAARVWALRVAFSRTVSDTPI